MMVGPISPRPSEFAIGGASRRAISSQKMDCCIRLALCPPYSFGHETAAHPPSYSFCCQARKYGNDSSMGFSRHSFQSFGTLVSSQVRSSSRNCFSSAVRFRSIHDPPSFPLPAIHIAFARDEQNRHTYAAELFAPDGIVFGGWGSYLCQYFLWSSFFEP